MTWNGRLAYDFCVRRRSVSTNDACGRPWAHLNLLKKAWLAPHTQAVCKLFGVAVVTSLLSSCKPTSEQDSTFPRSETFYLGGPQWGELASINPLHGSADWPLRNCNLLYEPLFIYNPLKGDMQPLLAERYEQRPEEIEVTLRPEVRWSDGKPLTAIDVKYTFELGKQYKSLPVAPLWPYLEEIRLGDKGSKEHPLSVIFVLNKQLYNPLKVLDSLQEQRIVPEHSIQPALARANNDINEFLKQKFDDHPVISGPYQLHSHTTEKIVLVRRDEYWGNQALHNGQLPGPKYIIHPIYKSNDHYSIALQQGRLDASSSFIPRLWRKQRKGVRAWFDEAPYFISAAIPMLLINVTKAPLSDRALRRAMAFAINYKDIRELAVSGYSAPIRPGLVLPFGPESKYFNKQDAKRYGASVYNPKRARQTLVEAGYTSTWDEDGRLLGTQDKDGNKLPTLYIKSPTGWTDWESIVRIAVKSMRAAGIDVRERFIDSSLFWQATSTGDFDLIMNMPSSAQTPSKPWSRFEAVLSSKDWAPLGEKMYMNQGRFNNPNDPGYNPRITELLTLIPTLTDESAKQQAYQELNRLYMQAQPTLPVVYRPEAFYEFSNKHWQGFPTAKHPFLPPFIPGRGLGTGILWHLKPVASKN